jgi:hypothetical protein
MSFPNRAEWSTFETFRQYEPQRTLPGGLVVGSLCTVMILLQEPHPSGRIAVAFPCEILDAVKHYDETDVLFGQLSQGQVIQEVHKAILPDGHMNLIRPSHLAITGIAVKCGYVYSVNEELGHDLSELEIVLDQTRSLVAAV